jgi:hypothetical protein
MYEYIEFARWSGQSLPYILFVEIGEVDFIIVPFYILC